MSKTNKVTKVQIGTWLLDRYRTKLVGRLDWRGGQGSASLPNLDEPCCIIEVALVGDWVETFDAVIHEALELVLLDMRFVWGAPENTFHNSSANRLFVMDHLQYTEAMRTASDFLAMCLSGSRPLEKAWCKANKVGMLK